MRIRLALSLLIAFFSLTAASPARPETGVPTAHVKAFLEKAMEIQTRQELAGEAHREERAQLFRPLIADTFIISEMAKESLKDIWDKLSRKQSHEFRDLFSELFQDSYIRMVLKEKIEYNGESPADRGVRVKTALMRENGSIPVDYYLIEKKRGKWLIRDVEIDGVSLVDSYKETFRRFIQASSFDGLIEKMRTQIPALREER